MVVPPPDLTLAAAVVASSPLTTIVLDDAGVVIGFNPAAERVTGRAATEVVGRPAAELFPDVEVVRALALIDGFRLGGGQEAEFALRTASGEPVSVALSWAPLRHEGQRSGMVGVGRDIARRRRLQYELARMAESFRGLAEGSDLGVYRFSFAPELHVDYVNPHLEEMIGWSFSELAADPAPLWLRLAPETRAALDQARRGGEVQWPITGSWRRPDGQVLELEFREVELRDVSGRLEAVLGMVRDITMQRRQEAALASALELERAATDRLRRVDELRKVFLQAVSHELRTPLTAVLGFSATLRDRADQLPAERSAAMAGRLHSQASRMKRLLDDLLDVDRLSRGALAIDRVPTDLASLVQRVVEDVGDQRLELDLVPCVAAVDPAKIERILVNLLINARRHAGPTATVRAALFDGEPVRLVVEDDGPGIPEDQRRTVFEPFAQGRSATGDASPGTGIGLTLVAAFTELHGGRAWVESSALGGARFVVELPSG